MKRMIGVVAVFGIVTLAHAQTDAPAVRLVADTLGGAQGRGTELKGAIELTLPDGARITADEADVDPSSGSLELRGNVRVTLSPTAFPKWNIHVRRP